MAVTVTQILNTPTRVAFDIIATADADVAAVVPHGLTVPPELVWLAPLATQYYLSTWFVGVIDATNVNLTKANAVGSGTAGAQVRVFATRPQVRPL